MASEEKVTEVLDDLMFLYRGKGDSPYQTDDDLIRMVSLWNKRLDFLTDEQLEAAALEASRSCRWFPTVADIVEAHKMTRGRVRENKPRALTQGRIWDNFFSVEGVDSPIEILPEGETHGTD